MSATNGRSQPTFQLYDSSPTFQMARQQLQTVGEVIDIDPGILDRLSLPKRAQVVSIPVRMEDDRTEMFIGYRVQHSLTSGPSKGGLRYHPAVDLGEVARRLAPAVATARVVLLVREGAGLALRRGADVLDTGVAGPDGSAGWDRIALTRAATGLADEILAFGPDVVVEEPAEVRQRVVDRLSAAVGPAAGERA